MPKAKSPPPAAPTPPPPPLTPPVPAAPPMPPQVAPVAATESHSHRSLIVAVIGLVAIACVGGATAYFLLGGSSDDSPAPSVQTPPVVEDTTPPPPAWTEVGGPALTAQTFMGVSVHDDMLMVVGGLQGDASPVKDVVAYNGTEWTKTGDFPVSISRSAVLTYNDMLWSFGGVSPALDPSNTNAIYASADGVTWSKKGSLPGTRFQSPILLGKTGALWSIGGKYIDPTSKSTALSRRVFSSTNGTTWQEAGDNSLTVAVGGSAAVSYGDALWLIGGGSLDANQKIQPGITTFSSNDGQTWEPRANAPLSIANACSVVYNGRVWLIGGETTGGASSAVYSSEDGVSWTMEAMLPQTMAAPGCAVYKGALFVVGNGTAYRMGDMTDAAMMEPPILPLGGDADAMNDQPVSLKVTSQQTFEIWDVLNTKEIEVTWEPKTADVAKVELAFLKPAYASGNCAFGEVHDITSRGSLSSGVWKTDLKAIGPYVGDRAMLFTKITTTDGLSAFSPKGVIMKIDNDTESNGYFEISKRNAQLCIIDPATGILQ